MERRAGQGRGNLYADGTRPVCLASLEVVSAVDIFQLMTMKTYEPKEHQTSALSPVSQRSYHQPSRIPNVLVRVNRVGVGLSDVAVLALPVPVELELREPLKRIHLHAT